MNRIQDTHLSIHAYVRINDGQLENYKKAGAVCMNLIQSQPDLLYYNFSYAQDDQGHKAYAREGYRNGEALLKHCEENDEKIKELSKYSKFIKLECHCSSRDWEVVRGKLEGFGCEFWEIDANGSFNKNI